MKFGLFGIALLGSLAVQAQLSGTVTDEKNQPLPGVTLRLCTNADSVVLQTTRTNTAGYFQLPQQANTYLEIQHTGYQLHRITNPTGNLGGIVLIPYPNWLGGVTVKTRLPFVQQGTDRTTISVNSQVLKLADNALDVIRLAPGLTISDNEDAIALSGKDAVQVMINDKPVRLSSRDLVKLLKSMPASSLSQLEVMSNPSARYDVTGNTALLNIKTRQNVIRGLTGNLDASTSQGVHNMGDVSGLFNYGTPKLAVSTYLGWHYGTYQTRYNKETMLNSNLLAQQNTSLDKWRDPVVRVTAEYHLNSRQTIGWLVEREVSTNKGSYETTSQIAGQQTNTYAYNPNKRYWTTFNINYRYADTTGNEFTVDVDRAGYTKEDTSRIDTDAQSLLQYITHTVITITTAKADYTHNWKNKWKMEGGVKLSAVNTDNRFTQSDVPGNDYFVYREKVNSAYANLSKNYRKWGWQLGIRLEQTHVKGTGTDAAGTHFQRPDSAYTNWLPAVYLSWQPLADQHLRLSLNQRIKRPDYTDLQPFTYQTDPYHYQTGNPLLQAQKNTNIELSYTCKEKFTLTAAYTHTGNYFNPVQYRKGDITYQTTQNAGTMNNWDINLNYPITIRKWWTMVNKASGFYNHFSGQLLGGMLNNGQWSYTASTSQRFTLPAKLQLQLSARYASPVTNLIYHQGSNANVSLGLSRKLFNNKGSVGISVSDIFLTQRNITTVNFGSLQYTSYSTWESRRISLRFNWRFGNTKVQQTQDRETGNSDEKGRSGK